MTKTLYRIHWIANITGATGAGTGLFPMAEAKMYADAMNNEPENKALRLFHWIEPETVEDEQEGES